MCYIGAVLTVRLLGPVEVDRDGAPVDLGGPQQRAVLAHLALDVGRVVPVERLVDRLWGEDPPRTPLGTLQSYVSRLRRALEPDRRAGASPQVLVSEAPGYVLRVAPEQVDVHRFRALVDEARRHGAAGDHAAALATLDAALSLWRGPALAGVGPEDEVRTVVVRLDEEHAAAVEDRFDALLALGRHDEAVPLLQAAVDERPLRERLWALLALALYRGSRQAEALRALGAARAHLADELGLDPGPELRELESRILAHDPALRATPSAAPVGAEPAREAPVERPVELVGRHDEWAALEAALADAGRGRPRLVLVEGEPGIGKSTLCDAFLRRAVDGGWSVAVGRCVEPGLAPSLWPCIEVVRAMVTTTAPDAGAGPARADPLRRFVSSTDPGAALAPVEMADRFVALLRDLGERRWVILLDDLHWADRATLDVMALVLDRLADRSVVLVGAHRPPESVPGSLLGDALGRLGRAPLGVARVHMSPLATPEVARLMALTTGVTPADDVAARVQARAGGNPLFVTELARLAGERGVADADAVPDAIRDVVRGRLAGLPDRATAELEVAAVLGERFDLHTVMAASERDPDACLDALDAAIVTRILVPEADGFRFAHALVRDAVLAEVSTLRLARLHHRAAEAIAATRGDGPDEAEPIAFHRLAAATIADPVVTARAAVRAADVARWRNAPDASDTLAERALAVLGGAPRSPAAAAVEAEALEALVSAAYRRGDAASVARVTRRVAEQVERTGSDAARALGLFLGWGRVDDADDLASLAPEVEQARALAERTTDRYATVVSRFMVGSHALLSGRAEEAERELTAAVAAAGADPDVRPEHVPLVLLPTTASMASALRGDAEAARVHAHRRARAWMAQRAEVDPTAQTALAFGRALVAAILDEPAGVLDALADVPLVDEHGMVDDQGAMAEVLLGWARVRRGDAAGPAEVSDALARIERGTDRTLRGAMRSFTAAAHLELGDTGRALDLLQAAASEARSRGEAWWLAETLRLTARALRTAGDTAAADALLDDAAALAAQQGALLLTARVAAERAAHG